MADDKVIPLPGDVLQIPVFNPQDPTDVWGHEQVTVLEVEVRGKTGSTLKVTGTKGEIHFLNVNTIAELHEGGGWAKESAS